MAELCIGRVRLHPHLHSSCPSRGKQGPFAGMTFFLVGETGSLHHNVSMGLSLNIYICKHHPEGEIKIITTLCKLIFSLSLHLFIYGSRLVIRSLQVRSKSRSLAACVYPTNYVSLVPCFLEPSVVFNGALKFFSGHVGRGRRGWEKLAGNQLRQRGHTLVFCTSWEVEKAPWLSSSPLVLYMTPEQGTPQS